MKKTASLLERYVAVAERFAWLEGKFYCNRLREARPFAERLPNVTRGRKKKIAHEGKFNIRVIPKESSTQKRNRMICDKLIRRKKATGRPIVDKVNPERTLCYELAQELNLSCGRIENIWQEYKNEIQSTN